MKVVIEIDEKLYSHTQEYEVDGFNQENDTKLFMAIKKGTPLYYNPITIREKDSEPRTLKALVDERTNEVYIRQFTLDYWIKTKGCEVIDDGDSN